MVVLIEETFFRADLLKGKNILITAGPTEEPIDPVRVITNRSSGKMGYAIAEQLYLLGANVMIVSGPVSIQTNYKGIKIVPVSTAQEMFTACQQEQSKFEIGIFCAAVADYTVSIPEQLKIKKQGQDLHLTLHKTIDILATIGSQKQLNQKIIGFALETHDAEKNGLEKLKNKNADLIILNTFNQDNQVFNNELNKVSFIEPNESITNFEISSKKEIAERIANYIITNWVS